MALLQYDIAVVGEQSVHRALASIERRFASHNSSMSRTLGVSSSAAARRSPTAAVAAAKGQSAAIDREQQRQLKYWQNAHVQSQRARMAAEDKRHRAAVRNAEKESKLAAQAARQSLAGRRRFVDGAFGKVGSSVRGSLGAVGRFGGAALGLAGGFAAAGAIQSQMTESRLASQLANQAGDPSLKGGLLKESRGQRGFTGEQVLGGISEFVTKTGDLGTGRKLASSQAELSLATGADFGDLMATAGQAFNVLKKQIDDPVERLGELNKIMGVLAQQGALGAVEIKDLAQDFGKLGAATSKFEGGSPELLRTMGAFAQIAVQHGGANSSADASTAASRLANDMVVNRKRFDALLGPNSLQSKTDKTKLRAPQEIMADILEKTGGDIMETTGLFGEESGKIFTGMGAIFSEAEKKEKGSGRGAVMAEYQRFAGAELSGKDINARAASRLADPDLQFQEVTKQFNAVIGGQLMPVLLKLIPAFGDMMPYVEQGAKVFARMAESLAADPIGGVMKLVAAKLAFDLAASSAAAGASNLAKSLVGASASVGGASSGLGGAIAGAQLGIAAAAVIIASSLANFEKGEADMTAGGKKLNRLRELAGEAQKRVLTPEEQAEAQGIKRSLEENVVKAKAPGALEGVVGSALDLVKVGGSGHKDAEELFSPNRSVEVKTQEAFALEAGKLIAGIAKLTTAVTSAKLASAQPNTGNSPSPIKPHK